MRHSLFLEPISRRSGFFQYHPLFAQMLNIELTRRFPLWVEPLRASFAEYQAPPAPLGRISSAAVTEPLSEREREIVNLMAIGCSNRDIAGRLSIVEGTVKTHLKHIFGKLGASNRTEAVAIARSLLIIS
ncbi:MAG: hypothetical protein HGA19_06825 [Oscillochloris sp.]|nr:hypothetical protein [Oscillochloris sp.]